LTYLETLTAFLTEALRSIEAWAQNVPKALQTARRNSGSPFSTDRSPLDIDLFAPLWLQRQRVLLKLLYHTTLTSLYRPFLRFTPFSAHSVPLSDSHAIGALNHAMAVTNMLHQTLSETDILAGWHQACQYQWTATLSLLGFAFANPVCPPTPSALRTMNSAILIFEAFGHSFAVARSAAAMTRELKARAEFLIASFRAGLAGEFAAGSSSPPMSFSNWAAPATGTDVTAEEEELPTWDGPSPCSVGWSPSGGMLIVSMMLSSGRVLSIALARAPNDLATTSNQT
jgi:hypothetical protein